MHPETFETQSKTPNESDLQPKPPAMSSLYPNSVSEILHKIQGVRLGRNEHLTHLLFVDDVLIFCYCVEIEARTLKDILEFFCDATEMVTNINKSTISFTEVEEGIKQCFSSLFNFTISYLNTGFKYLRFFLKPNNCSVSN
jgi:hypothetical protein